MLKAEMNIRRCANENGASRCRLQTAWWTACCMSLLMIMAGFGWLYVVWQTPAAFQWMLQSAFINAYILWMLWTGLEKNRSRQNAGLPDTFGVANWLTIGRGLLIGALGGFLFQEPPGLAAGADWLVWLPGAIYTVAILMDYLDGFVARVMRSETRLGEWLDTRIDALGLLVAPVLAIGYDRLPIYYISVGLAYYLFQIGIWHRSQTDRPVIEIKAHPAKRMIAGFQMGLVAIALFPLFSGAVMTVAATIFMIPLLAGFLRDALVAGGYARVNGLQQTSWDRHFEFLLTRWLPIFLRFIICLTGIYFLYEFMVTPATGDHRVTIELLNAAMPFNLPVIPLFAMAAIAIAVGFMARFVALLVSVLVAAALSAWDSPFALFLLLSCALTLMLTGSGMGSIWQPEDKLFLERQGQKPALI
ncbi:MAG: CDP-alcohol phosphatidyltransferase family protein [Desulfobacterales bacterium]